MMAHSATAGREMDFRIYPVRFSFAAHEDLLFPPGKAANGLRGGLGSKLRKIACSGACAAGGHRHSENECVYGRLFEPVQREAGPSGLTMQPRPFVLRAAHLDGARIAQGERFDFRLNLFEESTAVLPYLAEAFRQLGEEGLGPGRRKAVLTDAGSVPPIVLSLSPAMGAVRRLRVNFLTPTELKQDGDTVDRPEFRVLAERVRDRLSTLRGLYQGGPLQMDFRVFGERAARVEMTRCAICPVTVMRRSSRTGQVHSLGGFRGWAEYAGDLTEFLPFLQAAQFTGVGRQTVWGKGELSVEHIAAP